MPDGWLGSNLESKVVVRDLGTMWNGGLGSGWNITLVRGAMWSPWYVMSDFDYRYHPLFKSS